MATVITVPFGQGYKNSNFNFIQGSDVNRSGTNQLRETGYNTAPIVAGTPVTVDSNGLVVPASLTSAANAVAVSDVNGVTNTFNGSNAPVYIANSDVPFYALGSSAGVKVAVQIDPALANTAILRGTPVFYDTVNNYFTTTSGANTIAITGASLVTGNAQTNGFTQGYGIINTAGVYTYTSKYVGLLVY